MTLNKEGLKDDEGYCKLSKVTVNCSVKRNHKITIKTFLSEFFNNGCYAMLLLDLSILGKHTVDYHEITQIMFPLFEDIYTYL